MSMEIMLRYIVGIAIAYGIGKWIYQLTVSANRYHYSA